MRRRDFLKLSATSAAGAIIFQACSLQDWGDGVPDREFEIASPQSIPADSLVHGDAFYATTYADSPDAPGLVVRVFQGRAKKIEGNPNHPVNNGKLMARQQSVLQDLYHPDRVRAPMRREREGGPASFGEITWNEALDALATIVQASQGSALFITEPLSGALKQVVDSFVEGIGGERITFQSLDETVLSEALLRVFGSAHLPTPDIANAQFVLSFGADWLHGWISPIQLSQAYAAFRRGSEGAGRGILYHVDTHMNGTAGAADRWVPVQPGYEGILALAVAGVIIDEGMATNEAGFAEVIGGASLPSPEEAAEQTGVSAEMIREIAERFAGQGPSVAFGGGAAGAQSNGLSNLVAIYALNVLVGNVNAPGGLLLSEGLPGPLAGLEREPGASALAWQEMAERIRSGEFETVFLHQANPVYGLPPGLGLDAALRNVSNLVSFSRYIDETSVNASLILPDNTALESWGSAVPAMSPGYPVIGFQQPVVLRFYDTQPVGDVLLSIAEEAGLAEVLPWPTMQDLIREQAELLRAAGGGNIQATGSASEYFTELIQTGLWMAQETAPAEAAPSGTMPEMAPPVYAGNEAEYPFFLVPYESSSLGSGQYANIPWLQGLPDPITTVTWASWVNLNPESAAELDVAFGDFVRVTTPAGEFEIQVYVNPATPPNVASIPMGQGHVFYTRYAEGRGVNVITLLDPTHQEADTGALAWGGVRANLQKVPGEFEKLPRMEGTVEMVAPDDYEIVRVAPPAESGE